MEIRNVEPRWMDQHRGSGRSVRLPGGLTLRVASTILRVRRGTSEPCRAVSWSSSRREVIIRKAVVVAGLLLTLAATTPANAGAAGVRLSADIGCLPSGGAHVSFSIENLGPRRLRIDPDFHLRLNATRVGDDVGTIVFVFPAPGWDVIRPGASRTFEIDMGEASEGLPGTDLSGLRLHLEAEVWLAGRAHPAVRTFSFAACDPPGA